MSTGDRHGARACVSLQVLTTLGLHDLVALREDLDRRVKEGNATLEEFGALDRTRRELARRADDDRSSHAS